MGYKLLRWTGGGLSGFRKGGRATKVEWRVMSYQGGGDGYVQNDNVMVNSNCFLVYLCSGDKF